MTTFKEYLEEGKQSFDNTLKISSTDAKKIAKNYGINWDISGDVWILTDVDEHVMSYNPRKGELYTDFDKPQIIDLIKFKG
jgi:hypothetical protein